jgi:uncharacterized protein
VMQCDPSGWDMERADLRLLDAVQIQLQLTLKGESLMVDAAIACAMECACARCLTAFERPVEKQCWLHYDVSRRHVVDMTDDIRQEIILDYPMVPLCQDNCAGLCARCGQNRNESTCAHDDEHEGEH